MIEHKPNYLQQYEFQCLLYYIHDKITACNLNGKAECNYFINCTLQECAINDFCEGWGSGKSKQQKYNMAAKCFSK